MTEEDIKKMLDDTPKGIQEQVVGSVKERAEQLGLVPPTGICIMPTGFLNGTDITDLYHAPRGLDVRVAFQNAGITLDKLEPEGVELLVQAHKDNNLVLPGIFISAAYMTGNGTLVNVALGVLANFATDWFRGKPGRARTKAAFLIEREENTLQTTFDGSPEEFLAYLKTVEKLAKPQPPKKKK